MNPLARKLLDWYAVNARRLPWRGHPDAYAVWVSEVMLQQTRVETVIPYFERWMKRFPTVSDLASAPLQEALVLWEGLGYYARLRSLHKAARMIMDVYGGTMPTSSPGLRRLPGVGAYTAAAVAALAFGEDTVALDGNLKRVFSRVLNLAVPVDTPAGGKLLGQSAQEYLPQGHASEYNQALMDLGATVCLPKNPRCHNCPLADLCQARREGLQESRPVLSPKKSIPHYTVTAAVFRREGRVLLAKRPASGLLGGMWEFPGGKAEPGEELPEALQREIREELGADVTVGEPLGVYRHAYTHFRITLHAFHCNLNGAPPRPLEAEAIEWVLTADLKGYPMGKVDRQIANRLAEG